MVMENNFGTIFGVFFVLIMGVIMIPLFLILLDDSKRVCEDRVGILKSVNGITDESRGLFSSGSVSRTSLLFEDGLIISFGYRINKPLQLGKPMVYQKCITPKGKISYLI